MVDHIDPPGSRSLTLGVHLALVFFGANRFRKVYRIHTSFRV